MQSSFFYQFGSRLVRLRLIQIICVVLTKELKNVQQKHMAVKVPLLCLKMSLFLPCRLPCACFPTHVRSACACSVPYFFILTDYSMCLGFLVYVIMSSQVLQADFCLLLRSFNLDSLGITDCGLCVETETCFILYCVDLLIYSIKKDLGCSPAVSTCIS